MGGAWRLRGYVVEGLLGRGASGEVWRARVAATGEKVALKRLPVRDDVQVRRAAAEAAKLTVLEHPHLVRLHALVPDHTDVVLVLDLAEGGSLADLLAARGRLTPGEVITAVAPVAAALAHVHAAGVVHGDVTPANILFTAGGNALLSDLGVARLTGDDDDAESTPAYVDPGVAIGGIPSELSDVFMLAATALHALTGEVPWPGDRSDDALARARTGDLGPLPARLADAGVPDAMAAVLCRALDRNPGRRGTAAAFALDLRHSGVPVAVELDAGRARPEPVPSEAVPPAPTATGPRHARHAAPAPGRRGRSGRGYPGRGRADRGAGRGAGAAGGSLSAAETPVVRVPPTARAQPPNRVSAPVRAPAEVWSSAEPPTWSSSLYPGGVAPPADSPPARGASSTRAAPPDAPPADLQPTRAEPSARGAPSGGVAPPRASASSDVVAPSDRVAPSGGVAPSPRGAPATRGAPPPTSRVHPRPRPELPRLPRARSDRGRRSRPATLGAGLLAALVLAVGGLLLSRHLDPSAGAQPPVARAVRSATHAVPPTSARSLSASPGRPASVAWRARVVALDALRGRAFAERRPDLLRRVYASSALLQADTAQLLRVVPAGCGLPGVRTAYRDVRVVAGAGQAVVTARVSLPATTLVCAGARSARAPAVAVTSMRLTLIGPAASARITDERPL